jgi:hypothetical protein
VSVELVYEWCGRLVAIGVVLGAVELLVSLREFRPQGIFDPKVIRGEMAVGFGPDWGGMLSTPAAAGAVTSMRLLAGLALLLAPWNPTLQACAWSAIAASSLFMRWRRQLGDDGADQMILIMSTAFALSSILHSAPGALEAGAYFVGAQACLSYVVAGVAKLLGPDWRAGNVIPLILATRTYGARRVASFLHRHALPTKILCWGTIALETSFVLAPVLPLPLLIALLAMGAGMHLGIAALMGLNGFFWAFVATYPAIVFLNQGVHHLLVAS